MFELVRWSYGRVDLAYPVAQWRIISRVAHLPAHDGNNDRSTWPTPNLPITNVLGRDVEETAELYRNDGFEVEIVDLDVNTWAEVHMDRRAHRIRLYARSGRVVRTTQG